MAVLCGVLAKWRKSNSVLDLNPAELEWGEELGDLAAPIEHAKGSTRWRALERGEV
jgi:hypothetical protein